MIRSKKEILDFLKGNREYLYEHFNILKIGLFGSFARSEQNLESDVDLIIEFTPGIKNLHDTKNELRQYLSLAFGRDVDIANEKFLKSYAKKQILDEVIFLRIEPSNF